MLDAATAERLIEIDGQPTAMLTLTPPGGLWTAAVCLGDLTIVLAAHKLEPTTLRLTALTDPAAALLGPEPDR